MALQLTPQQVQFLLSDRGNEQLRQAAEFPLTPASRLVDLQILRRELSPAEASAVVEQVLLRRRGRQKFRRAEAMLFLRDALEQATHSLVAQHRAQRFAGISLVADLGCGIGGDMLWLVQAADRVVGFDANPVRLAFAQHNAVVHNLGRKTSLIQANILNPPVSLTNIEAFFADPSRRTVSGKRSFDPRQYSPPLDELMITYAHLPLGIKIAPGLDYAAIPATEIEVVSLNGEVKEAVLWFNALATPGATRRATLLPGGDTLTDAASDDCPVDELGDYLYEPDPAVIRAGLVKHLGAQLNLHLVDEHIAYLSESAAIRSSFVKGYKIEARLPMKLKQINRYLKSHQIRRVNIKQRGTGLNPEAVYAQLKATKTGVERTLILVRLQNRHLALICRRLETQ